MLVAVVEHRDHPRRAESTLTLFGRCSLLQR